MYDKWIRWQMEISEEIAREEEVRRLTKERRDIQVELGYLYREKNRTYYEYERLKNAITLAKCRYEITDLKLATLDGRLTVIEEVKVIDKREKNLKSMIDLLSPVEREALLAELERMED